ncbi:hypothetical protein [Saccharothrix xinjiangensis]|uniref:Uncharacterized protein n=1 Tax=Saccharothrix xinjiangensis TaxID=204798 RepID=A0ABV9XZK7_9PSEU
MTETADTPPRRIRPDTWSRLLAPTSGLIDQPITLRRALLALDDHAIADEVHALTGPDTPEQDQQVLDGTLLYLRHLGASARGDHDAAEAIGTQAWSHTWFSRADWHDVRILAVLLWGIATGRLPDTTQGAVTLLLLSTTDDTTTHRILSSIRFRGLVPWDILHA